MPRVTHAVAFYLFFNYYKFLSGMFIAYCWVKLLEVPGLSGQSYSLENRHPRQKESP